MTLCMGFQLSADPDRAALKKIVTIIKKEFLLVKHPVKPKSWQIYANASDPKLKEKIYSELKKQFKHFNPTARKAELSQNDIKAALQKADTRYPCKTAAEIFECAEKEAEEKYPLVKKGDDIIIRYYQGGLSRNVAGVVQEVHGDGTAYTVNNRTIQLSWIRKSDRKFFDPEENKRLREKFIENFTRNFADIKKEYHLNLLSKQSKNLIANRENGFIFIYGQWLSVKEVADTICQRYENVTEKQNKITKNMHDARFQSKAGTHNPIYQRSESVTEKQNTITKNMHDAPSQSKTSIDKPRGGDHRVSMVFSSFDGDKNIEAAYSSLTCAEAIRHLEEALKLSPNEEHPRAQKWLKIFKEAQNYGFAPIMIAVHHNDMAWCDKLFAQGADINDKSNNVPLLAFYLANKNFKIQMFDYLLSRKPDVNLAEEKSGNTPLMIACRNQPIEIVKKLVQAGARVNLRNRNGETSLHFAMTRKDDQIPALVRYLVSQGAKTDIKSNDGSKPEDMLSAISDRRVRYQTSLILKNIALPAVSKFASWDGTEGVVNWKISISQIEFDGYSFASYRNKPGFVCYSNGSTFCYFSQKTGELAWVVFNDIGKDPMGRAQKMIDVQCEFLQKYYGQVELVNLPTRTGKLHHLTYWAYIVPFKGTFIGSCGATGRAMVHQLRVLNPAYFPTDEEYIREIYGKL